MELVIKNGSNGNTAFVDSSKRLHTYSVTETASRYASETGDSFNINTGIINLTSDSKSAILYVKNNESRDMIIEGIYYLIGNSTGGTGDVLISVLRNPTAGTIVSGASDVEIKGVNRNFGSSKTLSADMYKGAEGNTLTDGDKVIETILNQSPQRVFINAGDIILQKGSSIGIEITPASSNTDVDVEAALSVHLYDSNANS